MNAQLRGFLIFLTLSLAAGLLRASENTNIIVQLRLYEGFKEKEKFSAVVVSSYYLKKLSKEQVLSDVETEKEKISLKKIYNLKEVKDISSFDMVLEKGAKTIYSQEINLGGRELLVKLYILSRDRDRFKVEVSEQGRMSPPLMETEIIIPQEKTAVLGFEDSRGRIYFLSFHREKDRAVKNESKPVASILFPRLLKKVVPIYPQEAQDQGLAGDVVLKALINEAGDVTNLEVVQGVHRLLDEAAAAAIKQWKYRPWIVNGKPHPLEVSLKISFRLKEHEQKK